MPSDHFVARLVSDLKPVRRRSPMRDGLILGAVAVAELALAPWWQGMRPDMPMATHHPSFWWKLLSLGLITVAAAVVAVTSFDPVRSPRRGLWWVAALVVIVLAAGWGVDARQPGFGSLIERLDWRDGLSCVTQMATLSVPAVIVFGILMRRGAPTDTGGTALTVGIAAAAWGAFVFVFACPFDDPLYLVVWYTVGCGLVTLITRLVLPPLTRW
jgi:hypothetical protein